MGGSYGFIVLLVYCFIVLLVDLLYCVMVLCSGVGSVLFVCCCRMCCLVLYVVSVVYSGYRASVLLLC